MEKPGILDVHEVRACQLESSLYSVEPDSFESVRSGTLIFIHCSLLIGRVHAASKVQKGYALAINCTVWTIEWQYSPAYSLIVAVGNHKRIIHDFVSVQGKLKKSGPRHTPTPNNNTTNTQLSIFSAQHWMRLAQRHHFHARSPSRALTQGAGSILLGSRRFS